MIWEGISEFVAVAETMSFTAAAKQLGISTAQVSRQVSALEDRLSIKLLYRTTRKVSLTESGSVYFQHCRTVLDGLDDAERAVSNLNNKPRGIIRITAPVTYGEEKIVPLINDFSRLYPELEIIFNLTNKTMDLVEEGYDLAIRLGHLSDSSMMAKKLSRRIRHVCASPNYIEAYGVPYSLSELDKHNCLIGTTDMWRFQVSGKMKSIRISGNIRCNSGYGIMDAALKGVGIIQLPDHYVQRHIDTGQLITMLDKFREPEEGVWALYPHNRHLSPKIRLLVDYLSEKILINS